MVLCLCRRSFKLVFLIINGAKAQSSPSDKLELHPGAHVLHYSSTCFEGLKAFRHEDGSVYIFRMDANIARMQQSSELLSLPSVDGEDP